MKIRRAARGDAAAIAALWRELLAAHASLDARFALRDGAAAALDATVARALREDPDTALWVTEADAACVAFAAARVARSAHARESCRGEISELFVRPGARRRGVGRALAEAALAWARERGAARVEVRALAGNDAAQAFWRALGFGDFVDVLDRRL